MKNTWKKRLMQGERVKKKKGEAWYLKLISFSVNKCFPNKVCTVPLKGNLSCLVSRYKFLVSWDPYPFLQVGNYFSVSIKFLGIKFPLFKFKLFSYISSKTDMHSRETLGSLLNWHFSSYVHEDFCMGLFIKKKTRICNLIDYGFPQNTWKLSEF